MAASLEIFSGLLLCLLSLAAPNPSGNRRYIGENMDPSISLTANNFVVTGDGRAIVACGYFDYSFRIFSVDSGTRSLFSPLTLLFHLYPSGSSLEAILYRWVRYQKAQ